MATRRASRAPHTGTFVARSERDFQASRNVRLRGTPIGPDAARRQLTRTWHCYLACALHTDPPGPLACTCKTNPVLAPNSRHTANYRPQVHPCPPGLRTQPPGWVRRRIPAALLLLAFVRGPTSTVAKCHPPEQPVWCRINIQGRNLTFSLYNLVPGASYELQSWHHQQEVRDGYQDSYARRITPAGDVHEETVVLPMVKTVAQKFVFSTVLLNDCPDLRHLSPDDRLLAKKTKKGIVVEPPGSELEEHNPSVDELAWVAPEGADCIVAFIDGCHRCPDVRYIEASFDTKDQCLGSFPKSQAVSDELQCMESAQTLHARCHNRLYMQTEAAFLPTGRVQRFPQDEVAFSAMGHLQTHSLALMDMIKQQTVGLEQHAKLEANLEDLRRVLARFVCVGESSLVPTGAYCLQPQDPPVLLGPGWQLGRHHFPADPGLVTLLQPIFSNMSILDLGCGCGQYGAALTGVEYRGFDGALNVEEFTGGRVRWADLTLPLLVVAADFVMLLEVGEHVPVEHEAQVLNNAADNALCGLVISWAVPGQTGAFHVNLRSNAYIVDKVRARGFVLDDSLTREGRRRCQLPWFANTFMFFWRVDAPPQGAPLRSAGVAAGVESLEVVYDSK